MKLFDLVAGNEDPLVEALAFYLKHHFLYMMPLKQNEFINTIGVSIININQ